MRARLNGIWATPPGSSTPSCCSPPYTPGHQACEPLWSYQYNSYYEAVGTRHPRPERGLLSRPAIAEVLAWRHLVSARLEALLQDPPEGVTAMVLLLVLDGFHRQPWEPV